MTGYITYDCSTHSLSYDANEQRPSKWLPSPLFSLLTIRDKIKTRKTVGGNNVSIAATGSLFVGVN